MDWMEVWLPVRIFPALSVSMSFVVQTQKYLHFEVEQNRFEEKMCIYFTGDFVAVTSSSRKTKVVFACENCYHVFYYY